MCTLLWVIYMTEQIRNSQSYYVMFYKLPWQDLRLTKRFTFYITGIKPLCWDNILHEVPEQFVQLLIYQGDVTHIYDKFLKIWFSFSTFFFVIATLFRTILPPESLYDIKIWFYCGLLVQRTSTVNITVNHLLFYKITFMAFKLRLKKCHHDRILFLVSRYHLKTAKHLDELWKDSKEDG